MLLAQRFALAVNAILAQLNSEDVYVLGGSAPPEEWAGMVRAALARWWEVKDAASCRETLRWLAEEGHSAELERALTPGLGDGAEPPGPEAVQLARQVGGRALIAWDAGRTVNVAGWGFVAGYLGEREAWQHVVNAAAIAQRVYGSWEEFGRHYLLGKEHWSHDDDGTAEAIQDLRTEPGSPWACIPWSTELRIPGVPARLGPYWSRVAMRFATRPAPAGRPPDVRAVRIAPPARRVRSADGADLVAEGGRETWRDAFDLALGRDELQDHWGPLPRDLSQLAGISATLEAFTRHELVFRRAEERQGGDAAEQALLGLGYRSVGEFFAARATVLKHYGTPTGPTVAESVLDSADCHAATVKVGAELGLAPPPPREGGEGAGLEAAIEAIRSGVAQAARQRSGSAPGTVSALLGAAVSSAGPATTGDAEEPVPFERYCEMTAAMSVWSQSGADVMSEFPRAFGLSLVDYGRIATYWGARLAGEPRLMKSYVELVQRFTAQYQRR